MKKILSYIAVIAAMMNFAGCSNGNDAADSKCDVESNTVEDNYDNYTNTESQDSEENLETDEENGQTEEKEETEESVENSDNNEEKKSDEKSKKVIVIDPGHASRSNLEKEEQTPGSGIMKIKDGGGAQGNVSGTPEYAVNMSVAMKLKELLEVQNYTVIMTKTSNDVSLGNIERAEVGNDNNASLVIRIHCDSADSENAKGASMLVPAEVGYVKDVAQVSRKYGEIIINSLVETAHMNNRGISVRDDMTGFNWSKVPVVLVEMGFMSNPEEDRLLNDESYQNKLAQGLCNGIIRCFE